MNFYNDNDAYCAAWLGNLIAEGLIPDGEVETKDIQRIRPEELDGFTQAHFFAGIAGWSLALRLAGWPDDREVWTGSCPCQPFSQAGKRRGTRDERHLWPAWRELVAARRPPVLFGEQVASPLGREWVAGVRSDLEALGYEVGIADLCVAGVGAPHIRQRLWWVGIANRAGRPPREQATETAGQGRSSLAAGGDSGLGNAEGEGARTKPSVRRRSKSQRGGDARRLGDASEPRGGRNAGAVSRPQAQGSGKGCETGHFADEPIVAGGPSFWSDFDLVYCADGKARRTQPGTFPLAHGVPARVGKLRAYGNAIVPWLAATFVRAYLETTEGT